MRGFDGDVRAMSGGPDDRDCPEPIDSLDLLSIYSEFSSESPLVGVQRCGPQDVGLRLL